MNGDFLAIDKNRLDEECLKQPELYFQYAQKQADSQRRRDEASARVDVVKADLTRKIASDPTAYKCEKTTDTAISAAVLLQKEYQAAKDDLMDAQHDLATYTAAVVALEHRKRALTLLVDLHGSSYFSEVRPSTPAAKDSLNQAAKERTRTVGRLRRDGE